MITDSLFRVSLKSLITDTYGRVLVVKEIDRPFWDLPGGGMEYGETIEQAIKRELYEEVALDGEFDYKIMFVTEAHILPSRPIHQVRLIYRVIPKVLPSQPGADADDIKYIDPNDLKDSAHEFERNVYKYSQMLA